MSEKKPPNFAWLAQGVVEAQAAFEDAKKRESEATGASCTALNKLNECQRALDMAMTEMRKDAPRGTDWADKSRQVPA